MHSLQAAVFLGEKQGPIPMCSGVLYMTSYCQAMTGSYISEEFFMTPPKIQTPKQSHTMLSVMNVFHAYGYRIHVPGVYVKRA